MYDMFEKFRCTDVSEIGPAIICCLCPAALFEDIRYISIFQFQASGTWLLSTDN